MNGCMSEVLRSFFFVPGRCRQHDVGVDAGRAHAEIQRDQQVELSFRGLIVPGDLLRLHPAFCAKVLAQHPVRVPSKCLRKYSCPLPEEPSRLERQTNMLRGQLAGSSGSSQDSFRLARLDRLRDVFLRLHRRRAWRARRCLAGSACSCGAEGSQPIRSARTL